jgi:two-component system cell cycle sensor histidine kinase/response regulator CckA
MTHQDKDTILVVEDEPLMLRVIKAALERAEFNVLTAQDGIEAVAVYEQQKDEIALVLSDVLLPKLDGWEVYSRLKAINSAVQVVFTSGYFDSRLKADCEREGIRDLIPKPFRLDEVIRVIRSRIGPEPAC